MGKLVVKMLQVGAVCTNCYVAYHRDTKEGFIVDPGAEASRIASLVTSEGVDVKAILLTHGHFDHAGAAAELEKLYHVSIYAHEAEKETMEDMSLNLCGMIGKRETYHATDFVKDGDVLEIAGFSVKVLFTPGHTVGGVCYYIEKEQVLFSGDSLFCGSIGRTDFPKGSMSDLIRGVKDKLLVLPDYVNVYPGHNEMTTIGDEKCYNPYF